MPSLCYGWDVGGAHLKFAVVDGAGRLLDVRELACPLWEGPSVLPAAVTALAAEFGLRDGRHAITMTGELCDAFATRAEGVSTILDMLDVALGGTRLVYGANGWQTPAAARAHVDEVASMNWHATATFVAAALGDGCLVDIGSTTSDLVPFVRGQVIAQGRTDASRLERGELVYTGAVRTPVMAVVSCVPCRGAWRGVAAEHFATMADIYRVTGELPDGADLLPTADGRPADLVHSLRRLARMLGDDARPEDACVLGACARFIRLRQVERLLDALALIGSRDNAGECTGTLVGAGVGSFIAARLAGVQGAHFLDFATLANVPEALAARANAAAPAVALAHMLRELPA